MKNWAVVCVFVLLGGCKRNTVSEGTGKHPQTTTEAPHLGLTVVGVGRGTVFSFAHRDDSGRLDGRVLSLTIVREEGDAAGSICALSAKDRNGPLIQEKWIYGDIPGNYNGTCQDISPGDYAVYLDTPTGERRYRLSQTMSSSRVESWDDITGVPQAGGTPVW
jgi:hypothetical protein